MTKENFISYYRCHYKPILEYIKTQHANGEVVELEEKDFKLLALLKDDLEDVIPELKINTRLADKTASLNCLRSKQMEDCEIFTNGQMKLRLIQQQPDKAAFQHLDDNGDVMEYIIGTGCQFDGDKVTWNWGSYGLTMEQAFIVMTDKKRNACYKR